VGGLLYVIRPLGRLVPADSNTHEKIPKSSLARHALPTGFTLSEQIQTREWIPK